MQGEVVVFHLFDVGGSLDLPALERSLSGRQPLSAPQVGKGTPAYVEFPQPLVVPMAPAQVRTPMGPVEAQVTFLYFAIGGVSVRLRMPVQVADLVQLRAWGQSTVRLDEKDLGLAAAARALVERERPRWSSAVRERYTDRILHESYTVFAFHDVGEQAATFLETHAADVAALLKGEEAARLHEKEVKEALRKWFSYYEDDVVVVDWDAAIVVDPRRDYDDLLFVLEIANLQLLEFRAYDDYLDDVIQRGYDELEKLFRPRARLRGARRTAHDLSLLRMEIAEVADEADNITKFLGDWFLARVYQAAQEKFHLSAWRASVDEKLDVLHKQYQLAIAESDNRRLLVLELLIVLLFILDLALLVVQ